MILEMSPKMDVVFVDFSQEIVWQEATKNDALAHSVKQNFLICHTCQILVMSPQDVVDLCFSLTNSQWPKHWVRPRSLFPNC